MEHMLRGRTATRLNVHMPKRSTKLRTRGLALLIMAIGALLFPGVLAAAPSGGSQGGVTDSNLVAYWPFDAGSTRDVSGNNNDGVGSGITPTSDRFGRHNDAYQFDGVDDSISITNSPTLQIGTSDYTIAAWIRTTAAGSDGRVFSKGSWNCTTGYMMRLGGGDKIHLENASNGWCMVNVDSNTPVTDGAWHFVVGVVDRDVGAVIYVDGALDATQEIDTSFADLSNDRNPTIGVADEQVQVSPEFFNGTIDDVRIYNIALSPSEVSALYTPGNTSPGGEIREPLVGYWSFVGGNARDRSGNHNDGVASGVTRTRDRFGRPNHALLFDGVDDSISIANSPTLQIGTSDYTIAAWIRTTAAGSDGRVFSKGSWNCTTGYMMRLGGGDKIHLENASNGWCMVNVDSNTPVTDGAWHFVVGVVDRDVGAAIYIDGALDATQEIDTSFANLSNDRNPTIGVADEQVQVSPEFFNGTIDDVRIYNIALSPGEVRALYSTDRKTSVQ